MQPLIGIIVTVSSVHGWLHNGVARPLQMLHWQQSLVPDLPVLLALGGCLPVPRH